MKNKIIILLTLAIVIGCKNSDTTNVVILNKLFKNELTNYIENNPIKNNPKYIDGHAVASPSYHIFFDKKNKDTIVSIKLLPHLTSFNIFHSKESNDSIQIFDEIEPLGFFIINKKPVIIFDLNNYSQGIIKKEKLKKVIPDSLKFVIGNVNYHIKSATNYYKLSNKKLEEIIMDKKLE